MKKPTKVNSPQGKLARRIRTAGHALRTPPAKNEVEVSVFGPGYGECITVHLGNGRWMIIDSCREKKSKIPVALNYLRELGVKPEKQVCRVVATHWHDDHIQGLAEVFTVCKKASFWCSAALQGKEWQDLLARPDKPFKRSGSGASEMRRIMEEIARRMPMPGVPSPKLALEGVTVYQARSVRVEAYAPSGGTLLSMQSKFKKLQQETCTTRRLPAMGANDGSVVLSLSLGAVSVLLGGDLEERVAGRANLGWTGVMEHSRSRGGRRMLHHVYKVAHHGSSTGHHKALKSELMEPQSWAVVTPWNRSHQCLPTKQDVLRICADYGRRAYLTAPPKPADYLHPNPSVNRAFHEMRAHITDAYSEHGHVRLRYHPGGKGWQAKLFGNAICLADMKRFSEYKFF